MAILTASEIRKEVEAGRIRIDPFVEDQLNPNSYNVRLGSQIGWYEKAHPPYWIDTRLPVELLRFDMKATGATDPHFDLAPGRVYLGHTIEIVGSSSYVPILDGRSSLARLGITAQLSAGFGDLGFFGQWTLEITCQHPTRIYAGMPFAQVSFHAVCGPITQLYRGRYQGQDGPTASRLAQ